MTREALDDYSEKMVEGSPTLKLIQEEETCKKRKPDPGIAASEKFLYEIMQLCLVMTLTSLHQLRKIRAFKNKKKSG